MPILINDILSLNFFFRWCMVEVDKNESVAYKDKFALWWYLHSRVTSTAYFVWLYFVERWRLGHASRRMKPTRLFLPLVPGKLPLPSRTVSSALAPASTSASNHRILVEYITLSLILVPFEYFGVSIRECPTREMRIEANIWTAQIRATAYDLSPSAQIPTKEWTSMESPER